MGKDNGNCRSLSLRLSELLREAQAAHHKAVETGIATDADWPAFYAEFLCIRLRPVISCMQSTRPVEMAQAKVHTAVYDDGPGWFAQLAHLGD